MMSPMMNRKTFLLGAVALTISAPAFAQTMPATLDQPVHIGVGQKIGMRKNASARQEAKVVQRRCVGDTEPLQHVAMRPVAFRAMRLHVAPAFGRQCAEPAQGRIGAGRDEARREHRQHTSVPIIRMAADMVDHRACV